MGGAQFVHLALCNLVDHGAYSKMSCLRDAFEVTKFQVLTPVSEIHLCMIAVSHYVTGLQTGTSDTHRKMCDKVVPGLQQRRQRHLVEDSLERWCRMILTGVWLLKICQGKIALS